MAVAELGQAAKPHCADEHDGSAWRHCCWLRAAVSARSRSASTTPSPGSGALGDGLIGSGTLSNLKTLVADMVIDVI
jgi:hypothetical protein